MTLTVHLTLTPSQENYLEHIWHLSRNGRVRVVDLAEAVGVKRPSVTRAVNNLTALGLVRHEQYGTIEFTAKGFRAARYIARRDASLKLFLTEVLLFDPLKADEEVCRLEHVVGDEVLRRLDVLVKLVQTNKSVQRKLEQELQSNPLARKPGNHAIGAKLHV